MKARYSLRVIQGNNVGFQVPVTVIASSTKEARQKALALTNVHSPTIRIDNVVEVEDAGDEQ